MTSSKKHCGENYLKPAGFFDRAASLSQNSRSSRPYTLSSGPQLVPCGPTRKRDQEAAGAWRNPRDRFRRRPCVRNSRKFHPRPSPPPVGGVATWKSLAQHPRLTCRRRGPRPAPAACRRGRWGTPPCWSRSTGTPAGRGPRGGSSRARRSRRPRTGRISGRKMSWSGFGRGTGARAGPGLFAVDSQRPSDFRDGSGRQWHAMSMDRSARLCPYKERVSGALPSIFFFG